MAWKLATVLEAGVYAALTAVFVMAGAYGLVVALGSSLPSDLPIVDLMLAIGFVVGLAAIVLLGAVVGTGEE